MRFFLMLFLTLAFVPKSLAQFEKEKDRGKAALIKRDLAKLQGAWDVVGYEMSEDVSPLIIRSLRAELEKKTQYRFSRKMVMILNTRGDKNLVEWPFTIDPTESQPVLYLEDDGGEELIYRVKDEELRLAWIFGNSSKRPRSFDTKKNPKLIVVVLRKNVLEKKKK